MLAAFSKCSRNKKKDSAQGSFEVQRSVYITASGKLPGEKKARLKKVIIYLLIYLVSQNKMYFYRWLYCAFYKFLEV